MFSLGLSVISQAMVKLWPIVTKFFENEFFFAEIPGKACSIIEDVIKIGLYGVKMVKEFCELRAYLAPNLDEQIKWMEKAVEIEEKLAAKESLIRVKALILNDFFEDFCLLHWHNFLKYDANYLDIQF